MPDREKVMEALDCLAHGGGTYDCLRFPCPYGFYGYTDCHKWEIARDSLELLKEKDAEISKISNAYLDLVGKTSKQPEIVRCRDCKNLGYTNSHWFCKWLNRCVDEDWFCADGVAKDINVPDKEGR